MIPDVSIPNSRPAAYLRDGQWLVKRVLLCATLVFALSAAAAFLTSAGIDPSQETTAE